jgi:hypothetical protein
MMTVQYRFVLFLCFVALILCTANSPIYAQEAFFNCPAKLYWINAGLGGSSFGISPGVCLSYRNRGNLISIRFIYNEEINLQIFGPGPSPSESVWDLGALYGRNAKTLHGLASVSGGVSLVGGVRRGRYLSNSGGWWSSTDSYEKLTFLTVGVPIEVQLFWTPLSSLGIGIYGFANLNRQKSFAGALLCVQIGKLQ